MELKRIIARDTRAANEKAIQLYGEDVLIISTQRVDNQTELIVAVDVRPEPQTLRQSPAFVPSLSAAPASPVASTPAVAESLKPSAPAAPSQAPVMRAAPLDTLGQSPAPVSARVIEPVAAAGAPFVSFSDWLQGAMLSEGGPVTAPAPAVAAPVATTANADSAPADPGLPAALAFGAARSTQGAAPGPLPEAPSLTAPSSAVPAPRTRRVKPQPPVPALDLGRPESTPVARKTAKAVTKPVSTKASSTAPVSTPSAQAQAHELRRSQEIVDLLRQEMAALRQEFALSRQLGAVQDLKACAPAIGQLAAQLQDLGVPATLRTLLLDGVRDLDSAEEALAVMQQTLERSLARDAQGPAQPLRGMNALCGPSGAGKSAMTARLAHAAAQQFGAEQVAMISLADSRPGAWGQLQVLAAQAGVECYRASDMGMLKVLLDELHQRSAVFIDTAGTDFLQQAQALAREYPAVQRHAVLPVDATVTSVQKIFQTSSLTWSCLMLSKMDEAAHPWPLVKALCDHPLPVGAVASSDRITLPVQAFDASRLAALAMAGLQAQAVPAVEPASTRTSPARQRSASPASRRQRTRTESVHA